jgi:uncharacterized protein YkwD
MTEGPLSIATKNCNSSFSTQKKQLSLFKLIRKNSQSKTALNESQKYSPQRQLATRNIFIEDDEPLCSTKENLDHHNCWEYLGSSSKNLMENINSKLPPCHTRNISDTTTSSTISAISIDTEKLKAAAEFGKVVTRNRRLPTVVPGFLTGNHLLVNKERISRHLPALYRRLELDQLAKERAESMAKSGKVQRADRAFMLSRLMPCIAFAENVGVGTSIQDIHFQMLSSDADTKNMISSTFSVFGMGTAKGRNGKIYLCQLFKG